MHAGEKSACISGVKQIAATAIDGYYKGKLTNFQPFHRLAAQILKGDYLAGRHTFGGQSARPAHGTQIHRLITAIASTTAGARPPFPMVAVTPLSYKRGA